MTAAVIALTLWVSTVTAAPPDPVKPAVARGLRWLAAQQQADGHWSGANDTYPTVITGYCGLALLMEGSTLTRGTYAPHLRKAAAWVEKSASAKGLIGGTNGTEQSWDTVGHAVATLFLICALDTDEDPERAARLRKVVTRALDHLGASRTARGGWGYGTNLYKDNDDSYTTTVVVQTLFAARRVGFEVPKGAAENGLAYLVRATRADGTLAYYNHVASDNSALESNPELPASAAFGALMSDGPRPDALARWVRAAKAGTSPAKQKLATNPMALYQHYFLARTAYGLGDQGHRRAAPTAAPADLLTWSGYKATAFGPLCAARDRDGGWPGGYFGRAHTTATVLIVLQLDNGYLPALAR